MSVKSISIKDLKVGMYVEAILEQSGKKQVVQQGLIKDSDVLHSLKKSGVLKVSVNLSKSQLENKLETADKSSVETIDKKSLSGNSKDVTAARRLYDQAKVLQAKTLQSFKDGQVIDIKPIAEVSDHLVDLLFNSKDALLCASMIRTKDEYLLEHSINVSILLATFARFLGLAEPVIRDLALGGFLHDIGKIKVPDHILNKPGALTVQEYELMKQHVNFGLEAVLEIEGFSEVSREVIGLHHEKLNGNGYPNRISENGIGQYGRMAAIVDCFDAITANRVYKESELSTKAFKILLADSDTHFDKGLVVSFIKCLGVYPVGSLVELSNGRLGLVLQSNNSNPLKPKLKVFYNWREKRFIEISEIDLSVRKDNLEIVKSINTNQLPFDFTQFFNEYMI